MSLFELKSHFKGFEINCYTMNQVIVGIYEVSAPVFWCQRSDAEMLIYAETFLREDF